MASNVPIAGLIFDMEYWYARYRSSTYGDRFLSGTGPSLNANITSFLSPSELESASDLLTIWCWAGSSGRHDDTLTYMGMVEGTINSTGLGRIGINATGSIGGYEHYDLIVVANDAPDIKIFEFQNRYGAYINIITTLCDYVFVDTNVNWRAYLSDNNSGAGYGNADPSIGNYREYDEFNCMRVVQVDIDFGDGLGWNIDVSGLGGGTGIGNQQITGTRQWDAPGIKNLQIKTYDPQGLTDIESVDLEVRVRWQQPIVDIVPYYDINGGVGSPNWTLTASDPLPLASNAVAYYRFEALELTDSSDVIRNQPNGTWSWTIDSSNYEGNWEIWLENGNGTYEYAHVTNQYYIEHAFTTDDYDNAVNDQIRVRVRVYYTDNDSNINDKFYVETIETFTLNVPYIDLYFQSNTSSGWSALDFDEPEVLPIHASFEGQYRFGYTVAADETLYKNNAIESWFLEGKRRSDSVWEAVPGGTYGDFDIFPFTFGGIEWEDYTEFRVTLTMMIPDGYGDNRVYNVTNTGYTLETYAPPTISINVTYPDDLLIANIVDGGSINLPLNASYVKGSFKFKYNIDFDTDNTISGPDFDWVIEGFDTGWDSIDTISDTGEIAHVFTESEYLTYQNPTGIYNADELNQFRVTSSVTWFNGYVDMDGSELYKPLVTSDLTATLDTFEWEKHDKGFAYNPYYGITLNEDLLFRVDNVGSSIGYLVVDDDTAQGFNYVININSIDWYQLEDVVETIPHIGQTYTDIVALQWTQAGDIDRKAKVIIDFFNGYTDVLFDSGYETIPLNFDLDLVVIHTNGVFTIDASNSVGEPAYIRWRIGIWSVNPDTNESGLMPLSRELAVLLRIYWDSTNNKNGFLGQTTAQAEVEMVSDLISSAWDSFDGFKSLGARAHLIEYPTDLITPYADIPDPQGVYWRIECSIWNGKLGVESQVAYKWWETKVQNLEIGTGECDIDLLVEVDTTRTYILLEQGHPSLISRIC
jgi:hypothetical protein